MALLTLQVDSPSLLEQLKNVLSLMRGVKIVSDSPVSRSAALEDVPNAETLAAMKEAESGLRILLKLVPYWNILPLLRKYPVSQTGLSLYFFFIVLIYFPAKLTIVCRYKDFYLFIFPSANIIVRAKVLHIAKNFHFLLGVF